MHGGSGHGPQRGAGPGQRVRRPPARDRREGDGRSDAGRRVGPGRTRPRAAPASHPRRGRQPGRGGQPGQVPDEGDGAAGRGRLRRAGGAGRRAGAFRPEVVLLDIGLPGMRRLRGGRGGCGSGPSSRGRCIVALTGLGAGGGPARSRAAGFDHHLVKPADPDCHPRTAQEDRGERWMRSGSDRPGRPRTISRSHTVARNVGSGLSPVWGEPRQGDRARTRRTPASVRFNSPRPPTSRKTTRTYALTLHDADPNDHRPHI